MSTVTFQRGMVSESGVWELARMSDPWVVSLLCPRHAAGDDTRQDAIRLKRLLADAVDDLRAGGVTPPRIGQFTAPVERLLEETPFWKAGGGGIGVYVDWRSCRVYMSPEPVPELSVVGMRPHIVPLLKPLQDDGAFYVLALSKNAVRLLRCTRWTQQRVPLPDAPSSVDEALRAKEFQEAWQSHTAGRPDGHMVSVSHGHGVGTDDVKEDLLEYFRLIDAGVRGALAVRREAEGRPRPPLVLACVAEHHPLYSRACGYPGLEASPVEGNPDRWSDEELRRRAWPLVAPRFAARREADARRYHDTVGGGAGRACDDVREVVQAAVHGAVEVLFCAADVQVWGHADAVTGQTNVNGSRRPGDVDLVNEACVRAMTYGAAVHVVDSDQLPGGPGAVNAILRW
jgi:hypothetical protein